MGKGGEQQGRSSVKGRNGEGVEWGRDIGGEEDREKEHGKEFDEKGYGWILVLVRLINLAPSLFRSIGSVCRITLNVP